MFLTTSYPLKICNLIVVGQSFPKNFIPKVKHDVHLDFTPSLKIFSRCTIVLHSFHFIYLYMANANLQKRHKNSKYGKVMQILYSLSISSYAKGTNRQHQSEWFLNLFTLKKLVATLYSCSYK